MKIDLQLEKAVKRISSTKARLICIQLPDGLKPRAKEIKDYLKSRTDTEIFFWLNSDYGACDLPYIDKMGFDLLIHFGHSGWTY